jgi:cell division protein FtsL
MSADNSILAASICIAFFTAIIACLMNVSDYIYRERNFLSILSDVYLETDKVVLK